MTRLTAPAEPDVLTTLQRTVADAACTPDGAVYASVSQYRPALLAGFLASTGLEFGPLP